MTVTINSPRAIDLGSHDFSRLGERGDVVYVLDHKLDLVWKNLAWDRFAVENEGENLINPEPRPISTFLTGHSASRWFAIYEMLLQSTYETYAELFICPSPSLRRSYRLRIHLLRDATGTVSHLVHVTHMFESAPDPHLELTPEWTRQAQLGEGIGLFAVASGVACLRRGRPDLVPGSGTPGCLGAGRCGRA